MPVRPGECSPGLSLCVTGDCALLRDLQLFKFEVKDKKSNVNLLAVSVQRKRFH